MQGRPYRGQQGQGRAAHLATRWAASVGGHQETGTEYLVHRYCGSSRDTSHMAAVAGKAGGGPHAPGRPRSVQWLRWRHRTRPGPACPWRWPDNSPTSSPTPAALTHLHDGCRLWQAQLIVDQEGHLPKGVDGGSELLVPLLALVHAHQAHLHRQLPKPGGRGDGELRLVFRRAPASLHFTGKKTPAQSRAVGLRHTPYRPPWKAWTPGQTGMLLPGSQAAATACTGIHASTLGDAHLHRMTHARLGWLIKST